MNEDPLRSEFAREAQHIAPGDAAEVLDGARRRVRRSRAWRRFGAVAAVAALVVGGAAVVRSATGEDEPATLVGVDPTTTTVTSTTVEAAPSTTVAASTTIAAAPATTGDAGASSAAVSAVQAPGLPYAEIAVPWQDGFLIVGTEPTPTPLPDSLPEDIQELFPPEVNELFPDGLPETLEEAQQTLSDADLLDVVVDILAANPEANDAIYSEPRPAPNSVARFTTDGEEWEDIEFVLPEGLEWVQASSSDGERLVVVSEVRDEVNGDATTVIAVTNDLQTWQTHELPAVAGWSDAPEFVHVHRSPMAVAVSGDRWVVRLNEQVNLEPTQVPGVDPALGNYGYSEMVDADGFTFAFVDETGRAIDTYELSWADLGVSPELAEEFVTAREGGDRTQIVSGSVDGEVVFAEPGRSRFVDAPIVATSAGFVEIGSTVRYSSDGFDWEDRFQFDDVGFHAGTLAYGDGLVTFFSTGEGTMSVRRFDAMGQDLGPVEVPGLPQSFMPFYMSYPAATPGSAMLVDVAPGPTFTPEPYVQSADGYELTLPANPDDPWILVDEATGDVVLEGTLNDTPFDNDTLLFGQTGITVVDPETGEDIVMFPHDMPTDEYIAPAVDLVLLATSDGQTFAVDAVGPIQPEEFMPPVLISNGDRVLVSVADEWRRYDSD